ncbi:hypothetical protein CRG98_020199 [Punica granatum]|uniref:Uncharacterized protein n=1 Tax=Punica granatum TaxID=22663 RepID=A0A2I0JU58_PUNGR|nr:hypothetical protein CRG98_020199 [Punica granatum]
MRLMVLEGIVEEQRKKLVEYWSNPTNANKREARDPSRLERFEYQHQHGDSSLINEEAAQLLDQAKREVEDCVSASKTDGLIVDRVAVKNEVFT